MIVHDVNYQVRIIRHLENKYKYFIWSEVSLNFKY